MTDVEAWQAFTQFADQQVGLVYSTMAIPEVTYTCTGEGGGETIILAAVQVQLSSEVSALQQAVASSHAAIYTLYSAGLAELASNHVLNRAKVCFILLQASTILPGPSECCVLANLHAPMIVFLHVMCASHVTLVIIL